MEDVNVVYDVNKLDDHELYSMELKDKNIINLLEPMNEEKRFIALARYIGTAPDGKGGTLILLNNLGGAHFNLDGKYYVTKVNNKIYYYDGKDTYSKNEKGEK